MDMASANRIAVSSLVQFVPTQPIKSTVPPDILVPPTQAELDAQIRRQNAEPVNAVFRVNGRVVATKQSSGTFFISNATAAMCGMCGMDPSIDSMEATLRQRYGDALRVERYPAGTGPAWGAIFAEIYGGKGHLVDTHA